MAGTINSIRQRPIKTTTTATHCHHHERNAVSFVVALCVGAEVTDVTSMADRTRTTVQPAAGSKEETALS